MARSKRDLPVADKAPSEDAITSYDHEHLITYLRLLDAEAEGADWTEVVRFVLEIDPERDPERARAVWESHLDRAKWMTIRGYRHLLLEGDRD
jgi:T6SS, Transcription factor, DNA binding domain